MLFKEKFLLSNCDSVRRLNEEELSKRFLTGLAFADGVIVTPNILIDNECIASVISRANVVKYLNEEGYGKFIVRGNNLNNEINLVDFFDNRPDDYIISSLPGRPRKSSITDQQRTLILTRLELLQERLDQISPKIENLSIEADALSKEIARRVNNSSCSIGMSGDKISELLSLSTQPMSRSQWYAFIDRLFSHRERYLAEKFKAEVIDPSYNSRFIMKGEAFLQDNIRIISNFPKLLLDAGVTLRALRNEAKLLGFAIEIFELIYSAGTGRLSSFLTDKALEYIEYKLEDFGKGYLSRKNWFGMYRIMQEKIGLEIK
ncbi:hypothetical protein D6779_02800 [Candidatus Parcubacteria bacterium]|nr:MAG: hypothetical protein D6779_02800 [Candidatus Parcubacteria bacterium]